MKTGTAVADFLLAFIPLFVAVDVVGILPMYLGLTEGFDTKSTRRVIIQSVVTAFGVGTIFLFIGRTLLRTLGISIADFMIAGGVVLFLLSASDLLLAEKPRRHVAAEDIGAVPVGVPLIVGPAVLTTALLLVEEYGAILTCTALAANIALAGAVLWISPAISRALGKSGAKIISKLAALQLAAYAVMMVRRGIFALL
jgi:multiple antibiotic resistance protein